MSKEYQFKWDWCGSCDAPYVICPKCQNNCCNGGYGRMTPQGEPVTFKESLTIETVNCDICPLAYQYQKDCPEPTRESFGSIPDEKVAKDKKFWGDLGLK